jgi:hypothetical protein
VARCRVQNGVVTYLAVVLFGFGFGGDETKVETGRGIEDVEWRYVTKRLDIGMWGCMEGRDAKY